MAGARVFCIHAISVYLEVPGVGPVEPTAALSGSGIEVAALEIGVPVGG